MEESKYYIRISPGVLKNDIFTVTYSGSPYTILDPVDPCCIIVSTGTTYTTTGSASVYSAMTKILSGGTNGSSILTGLTIPLLFTQSSVDLGYYTPTDGYILQKEIVNNFLFTGDTNNPYIYKVYNTSEVSKLGYLNDVSYYIDWGDSTPIQTFDNFIPNYRTHQYSQPSEFVISVSAITMFGTTIVKKTITTPYSAVTIDNPNGTVYFVSSVGSWSATPISVDYLYDYDSNNDPDYQATSNFSAFTSVPFVVTGYTFSTLNDLEQYGLSKYPPPGIPVTGSSGSVGIYYGPDPTNTYIAYKIGDVDYYDYEDFTIFAINSSGLTANELRSDLLVKEDVLLNVVMEPEVQSNVYVERGKMSGLESLQRLGEVSSVGDLENYGYGFFKVINTK